MILAAGRGERMRPLTDTLPKPLLRIGGQTLIEHQIHKLSQAGFCELVINHAHLGEQIVEALGDGSSYGVNIQYSAEPEGALETGGGIYHALPLLGDAPFVVVNTDIWTDFPFDTLPEAPDGLAHLVLVPNPDHHPEGDFTLAGQQVSESGEHKLTFGGIGVYLPALFKDATPGVFPLAPLLRAAMTTGQVTGECYDGRWSDIGTPERLDEINRFVINQT